MSFAAVQRPVRRELEQVQGLLRDAFRTSIPILNQVGGHVLATRGKKFRPTLLLLTARLRGRIGRDAVLSAAVVEMLHAAALIHDDAVDSSALRRGRPTVNGLWTDQMAIIMGDHLFGHAMNLMVRHRLELALEVLAGVRSAAEGAKALEVSLTRYYMLEQRALEALVAGCEPRRRGPGQDAGRQVERLTAKVGQLERELLRHQALIRAARRASGLGEPAQPKAAPVSEGGKRRRRGSPRVRALRGR
mgnify:CR=1 FL=1